MATFPTLSTPSPPLFSAAQTSSASSSSSSTATNEALLNNAALRTQSAAAVAISPLDNSERSTGNSQGKKRRNFSVEELDAQIIVTAFSKRKKDLESEKEGNVQSLESYRKRQGEMAEEMTSLQRRITSLQQEMANLDHYITSADYRLGQIQEETGPVERVLDIFLNPDKYPVVPTPSKRSRTAFSTPEGRLSAEEIRLLAEFYSSTEYVYYHRAQKVKVTGSNEQKFTVVPIDPPSEPFEASDEELTFFPEKGPHLIRWTKVPKAWAGKYFAAEVLSAKIKPDCISCKIVWTELKRTEEEEEGPRYLRNLSDILPFGPDHPNAKLLQKDTSERQGISRERYFLKKIDLTPENFLN